ncbi:MAG: hypothetical protein HOW73_38980 [Polyangiaceae bacterium]|nr:hypothetical protein [Polyangiaceae bacterium]
MRRYFDGVVFRSQLRAIAVASIVAFTPIGGGCGDDETDGPSTGGAGGAGGAEETGGSGGAGGGGGAANNDPLGLDQCDATLPSLDTAVALPAMSWESIDDQEVNCAFRALDAALADKRILCSGEGDHGVAQSSRWHSLLVRYLVHRWNVRVIAYEMPGADIEPWDRFLTSGDPDDLEQGFISTDGTLAGVVENESLLQAFRNVQLELPEGDRIRLVGFDISVQTEATLTALEAFLDVVAPSEVETLMTSLTTGTLQERATAAGELATQIEAEEAEYTAATDEARWRAARRDARNLQDGYNFLFYYQAGDYGTGNAGYREPGMIRNMEEIAASTPAEERVLMISHDFHCAKAVPAGGAANIEESPAVGTHLAMSETWGPQYAVIGQHYMEGTHLTFTGEDDFSAFASGLETAIGNATNEPAIIVGMGSTWLDFDKNWPVLANGQNAGLINPSEQYDAVLWLREATPTTPR